MVLGTEGSWDSCFVDRADARILCDWSASDGQGVDLGDTAIVGLEQELQDWSEDPVRKYEMPCSELRKIAYMVLCSKDMPSTSLI